MNGRKTNLISYIQELRKIWDSKQWQEQDASMPLGKETTCEGRARHRSLGSGWEIGEEVSSFVYARGLSHFSGVRLHATLWTVAHQAFLSMGFSRQEDWGGLACLPPRDLPDSGIEPASSALQVDSLPIEPSGKPSCLVYNHKNH